ncbi:MAG: hypothetical protein QXF61_03020 [Nitrososphaeria archaeon]
MKLKDLLNSKGKNHFYIVHLSYNGKNREKLWNFAKENSLIGLDLPGIVYDDWLKIRNSVARRVSKTWIRQFDTFCTEMQVGDVVIVLNGWDSVLGVAEITRDRHEYNRIFSDKQIFFDHIRKVKWLKTNEYNARQKLPTQLKGFNNTLSKVTPKSKRWELLTNLDV